MKRYKLRTLMTEDGEDGLEIIRVPRRKKSKHQKLDPNIPIEAEIIERRINALRERMRALH